VSMKASIRWLLAAACVFTTACGGLHDFGETSAAPAGPPGWEKELRGKLQRRITFCGPGIPIGEALNFYSKVADANIILDRSVDREMKLAFVWHDNMPMDASLRWIAREAGLGCVYRDGAVVLTDKAPPPEGEREGPWKQEIIKAMQSRVTYECRDQPIVECITFLRSFSGMNFIFDFRGVDPGTPVTVRLDDTDIETALGQVCRAVGLEFSYVDHAVWIRKQAGNSSSKTSGP
jgi:hypothetical protein